MQISENSIMLTLGFVFIRRLSNLVQILEPPGRWCGAIELLPISTQHGMGSRNRAGHVIQTKELDGT
jgi:hypothetical protein